MSVEAGPRRWVGTTPRTAQIANDVHSELNATRIARRFEPRTIEQVIEIVRRARRAHEPLAISGGRHAMGGQQFLSDGWLLDLKGLDRVRSIDLERGRIWADAGVLWPALMRHYLVMQREPRRAGRALWGIRQKQTGADRLTLGGAVSANIHGRVLTGGPFVEDVEALEILTADGERRVCSRTRDPMLFSHAVGGYGLFGVITGVELRLAPRRKIERLVTLTTIEELLPRLDERIAAGALYGDFQFSTWPGDERFLRTGVLSCYVPTDPERPIPTGQRRLSQGDWNRLLELAHVDKREAFERFTSFYLATHGQLYYSDSHQLNLYLESYHESLDRRLGACVRGSEMITEIYVPRARLVDFMSRVREDFRRHATNLIYGTIRLIDAETTTALPWAREPWACVIFNLHVDHRPADVERAAAAFRRLADLGIAAGGSFYLTYHRFASGAQIRAAHPRIDELMRAKRAIDPEERFQSDWYRYLKRELECAH